MNVKPADLTQIKKRVQPFTDPCWLYEIKHDGFRALANGGEASLQSRRASDFGLAFPELLLELDKLPDCAIDAELVVLQDVRCDFSTLQRRFRMTREMNIRHAALTKPASLIAFDLLSLEGRDMRREPIEKRKEALAALIARSERIHICQTFDDGVALFNAAEQNGFEGVVAKRRGSPYRAGPSFDWVKSKTSHGDRMDETRKA